MSDVDNYVMAEDVEPPPAEVLLERGMPASVEAERTILGAALLDVSAYHEAAESLIADDFSLDSHRRIFAAMTSLVAEDKNVDIITLSEELESRKELGTIGNRAYLFSLTENLPRRLSITDYIRIVKEKSVLRQLMGVCGLVQTRCADQSEDALTVLDGLERYLGELRDQSKSLLLKSSRGPFFVGYRTFTSTTPPSIEWTVGGLIQKEGRGLILGDSGTSKSLLVFDLALHLVAGVPWFEHDIPQRVKVGLVSREDAPGLSQSRLKRLVDGASGQLREYLEFRDLEDWLYVNTRTQRDTWSLQSKGDIEDIIAATTEKSINILFFDVFRTLWEGNENDNQETAKVLAAADRIGREAKCQVCIVHHLSKSDRGTIFDRARGGGINGWKEWGLGLTVENPDADPIDQVRKIQWHTKMACASSPIYYRIVGREDTLRIEQTEEPSAEYTPNYTQKNKEKKKDNQPEIPY
jgi:AAA domain/DnaB-like helicase N terminal domain